MVRRLKRENSVAALSARQPQVLSASFLTRLVHAAVKELFSRREISALIEIGGRHRHRLDLVRPAIREEPEHQEKGQEAQENSSERHGAFSGWHFRRGQSTGC